MHTISLVFETNNFPTDLLIYLNDNKLSFDAPTDINQYGDYVITVESQLQEQNHLAIKVIQEQVNLNLKEIIIDGVRFGLVTFLCTTINNQQQTQLTQNGTIDINFSTPIWQFWCQKMNDFNYKDYPLGSTNY